MPFFTWTWLTKLPTSVCPPRPPLLSWPCLNPLTLARHFSEALLRGPLGRRLYSWLRCSNWPFSQPEVQGDGLLLQALIWYRVLWRRTSGLEYPHGHKWGFVFLVCEAKLYHPSCTDREWPDNQSQVIRLSVMTQMAFQSHYSQVLYRLTPRLSYISIWKSNCLPISGKGRFPRWCRKTFWSGNQMWLDLPLWGRSAI